MIDGNPAESSAAAVAVPEFNPADQYTWSEQQRAKWNETGEIPAPPPKKSEPEPTATPAKEAISEPEGKTAAESETAPKQGKKERKPGEKLSAEERIAQLTAKVRELEDRERSRETAPKAAKEPEPAKKADAPKRPNPFAWTGTQEEYDAAMESWENHQRALAVQEFQRNELQRAQTERMKVQLEELKAKYPDAEGKLKVTLENLYSPETQAQLPGVIRGMLDDSECFTDLMYVLSDETTRSNFIATAKTNPGKAIRVLAQMERDIAAAEEKPAPPAKSESKPPVEPKPRAPKPPSEVGGRGTAPEDELRAAAASGDFRAFEAEQNRRKFARSA